MPKMRNKKLEMDKIEVDTKNPTTVKKEQAKRKAARKKKKRNRKIRTIVILFVALIIATVIGFYIYFLSTDSFKIEKVVYKGVDHLTNQEADQLVNLEEGTTLLKVDSDTIIKRLKRDAWVKDASVNLVFPDTLEINVVERSVTAVVEVPASSNDKAIRNWAISSDHMWLMPIPDKNSEVAQSISPQIYNDVEGVIHIVDVAPSVSPDIGTYCTDESVINAIDVVAAMTTDLKNQVKNVKASDVNSTNIFLNNGVEIAIGTDEDIREKERVCKELLEKYQGKISYINVRNPQTPTWRSI